MTRGEWTSNSDNVSLMKEKSGISPNAFKKENGTIGPLLGKLGQLGTGAERGENTNFASTPASCLKE